MLTSQKISSYPWAQYCAPHLPRQRKYCAAFIFSNCGNPAKPCSRYIEKICIKISTNLLSKSKVIFDGVPLVKNVLLVKMSVLLIA